jgi:hypothetical protein
MKRATTVPRVCDRCVHALARLLWAGAVLCLFGLYADPARASCSAPANPIEAENCNPGTDQSVWRVEGSGDSTIEGFATQMSVNAGQTVSFKIDTAATTYNIAIFRLGYYGGLGARQVATITPSATLPQAQPACLSDSTTNLADCGNWAVSASWNVPATAVSGLYIAVMTVPATGDRNQIFFVVRNDSRNSALVFKTSDATWQAYNDYGGHSLYGALSGFDLTNRAYKVSYNRPLVTPDLEPYSWPFYDTVPMIHWLEANGYDVTYITSPDLASSGSSLLLNHKVYLSVGHDEYVSGPERTAILAARNAGVNLAFFSGNEVFWKTRWEDSIDGSNTPYRTLVCYKESLGPYSVPTATAAVDPDDPPTWTGSWRDPKGGPPDDAGIPENALTGQLFRVNGTGPDNENNQSIQVPAAEGKLRFWRGTQVAAQSAGQVWTLPAGTLGYEWDAEEDNGFRPPGLFDLSTATYTLTTDYLQDAGGIYGAGVATHRMSLYRAASGALVFGAGTVQWSWGLDTDHDCGDPGCGPSDPDPNMQQATVNLLADMGVQPATLQSGLVPATASTDTTPPSSTITAPAQGATVHVAGTVTVTGTASDTGGGLVAGVEVSFDGGNTWHPATGTSSWTYTWVPTSTGTASLQSRAVDDSGNLETPSTAVSVDVAPPICPCTLFILQQPVQPSVSDAGTKYEMGMKFQASTPGQISAIRFWKSPSETGTHTGHIWSATGTQLASVTFSGETASGWQTQQLASPLMIDANATYVVSVNINSYYAATTSGLATQIVSGNLSSVADGKNGVYGSAGTFPTNSYDSTNYFTDIEFAGVAQVLAQSGDGQTGAPGTTLPEPLVAQVLDQNGNPISGTTVNFSVGSGGGSVSPASGVSDSNGKVTASATLGSTAGRNTFQASASGVGSVVFNESALQDTVLTTQVPQSTVTDNAAYELGMKFQAAEAGQISAIRFWKAVGEGGTHTGHIWSSSGTLLASVTFSGETASGWQLQALSTPVTIQANTEYVVSVSVNSYYVATNMGLASSIVNGYLSSIADGLNGLYGSPGNFPTSSYESTNYFVDVSFGNAALMQKVSGDGQIGEAGATLSSPLVVQLHDSNDNIASGVTVNFNVTAGGGAVAPASAVTDSSGNASTTLTLGPTAGANTVAATATGYGTVDFNETAVQGVLFTTQTPTAVNITDGQGYELGMKFQANVAGQITAIHFWKDSKETGTHVGNIWSASGTLLASVTFTGESASGWQVQQLTSPLTIQANTTYVVSVNVNSYYVATNEGLQTSVVNGALSSVADGANGVYSSKPGQFPTASYENTNYFRDITFAPQ